MSRINYRWCLAASALSASLLLGGCSGKIDPSATLVTINKGEDKIDLGYANFYARYTQATYDEYYLTQYDTTYWKQSPEGETVTMEESTKENILDDLKELYIGTKHAEEFDVKIDEDQEKKIDEVAKKFMKDNAGETAEKMGATEDYVKRMLREEVTRHELEKAMEKKKKDELTDDEVNQSAISVVYFVKGGVADEDGKAKEFTDDELKKMAEEAVKADDFEAYVKETGFDLDSDYYTTAGDDKKTAEDLAMPEEAAKAIRALKEGEISGVLKGNEDEGGYYVVRKDKDYDKEYSDVKRTNLAEEYYTDSMEKWTEKLDWKVDEKQWKKVKFDTAFEAPKKEEDESEATGDAVSSESQEITIDPTEADGSVEEAESEDGEAAEETDATEGEAAEETDATEGEAAEETDATEGEAAEETEAAEGEESADDAKKVKKNKKAKKNKKNKKNKQAAEGEAAE